MFAGVKANAAQALSVLCLQNPLLEQKKLVSEQDVRDLYALFRKAQDKGDNALSAGLGAALACLCIPLPSGHSPLFDALEACPSSSQYLGQLLN